MFLCRATYLVMQCIGGYMHRALGMQMTRAGLPVLLAVCIGVPWSSGGVRGRVAA
jgi:hypothetical protein